MRAVPNPHAYKNSHAISQDQVESQEKQEFFQQFAAQKTIVEQEVEESDGQSALNIVTKDQITRNELEEKQKVIDKYKRIDQVTLTRVGLKQK